MYMPLLPAHSCTHKKKLKKLKEEKTTKFEIKLKKKMKVFYRNNITRFFFIRTSKFCRGSLFLIFWLLQR